MGSWLTRSRRLGERQIMSLVLEGGVALQAAAWKAGLVDAVHLYVAPMTLGDDGVPGSTRTPSRSRRSSIAA